MTDEIMNVRASLLLPSNMNMAEFEEKIFGQAAAAAATPAVRAKTIEDVIFLLGKHRGVIGVMLMNKAGQIIHSNYEGPITGMYCGIAKQILDVMTPTINSATTKPSAVNIIRINSSSQEVILAPVAGEDLIFVIVQNPEDQASIASCTRGGGGPVGPQESRLLGARLADLKEGKSKVDSTRPEK